MHHQMCVHPDLLLWPKLNPMHLRRFGEGMTLYQKYKLLAEAERNAIFIGRLATFSYLDTWMAVAQAMEKLPSIPKKGSRKRGREKNPDKWIAVPTGFVANFQANGDAGVVSSTVQLQMFSPKVHLRR